MKILVVGGGGREHAIIRKIKENPRATEIYALPGNGGIASDATCIPIAATDIESIVRFACDTGIDFAIVAPDDPLVLGAVDALTDASIRCFGPTKAAAHIEGSKAFAKAFMRKYSIPTADYAVFDDADAAIAYLHTCKYPTVIKADGLALGKGVIIADNEVEAIAVVRMMLCEKRFGESGTRVVIEEYLEGPEITVLAFTDGETIVPMVSSMDHKRALDGDKGPNTGGMGVIAPNPFYTEDVAKRCKQEIMQPTIDGMRKEGRLFRGCLYFGLMLTADGPKVIEYNCRFGDPEAQTVLPLLISDLLDIMEATAEGRLAEMDVCFQDKAACCVMVVSGGYPDAYNKGLPITIDALPNHTMLFHSGTKCAGEGLVTAGGRVIGAVAVGNTLAHAIKEAYQAASKVHFEGSFYRRDIGHKALLSLTDG